MRVSEKKQAESKIVAVASSLSKRKSHTTAIQLKDNRTTVVQMAGRNHADRVYKVTVSPSWMKDGKMQYGTVESYSFPYTSDDKPTAPLEKEAKRLYRKAHPDTPKGGPQMKMNVNGRALQG